MGLLHDPHTSAVPAHDVLGDLTHYLDRKAARPRTEIEHTFISLNHPSFLVSFFSK
jgi:hypothetical protein